MRPFSDAELEEVLISDEITISSYFFLDDSPSIYYWHPVGGSIILTISNDDLYHACGHYLKKRGVPSFSTISDAIEHFR